MKTAVFVFPLLLLMVCFESAADQTPRGQQVFERRCAGCHGLDRSKEGPALRGVYGRKAGALTAFTYSDALKNSQITWTANTLDRWLTNPEAMVPETDMAFRVNNVEERKQIVAYLKQISARE